MIREKEGMVERLGEMRNGRTERIEKGSRERIEKEKREKRERDKRELRRGGWPKEIKKQFHMHK